MRPESAAHLMATDKFKASALVLIQGVSIATILVTGWPLARSVSLLTVQVAGLSLGTWAVVVMGLRNTNIAPLVKQDARLVTRGPYALIRHPMYSAVLLAVWPLIIDDYSLLRLAAGLILTIDLIVKLLYEERLLRKHFADYEPYMRTTKRLIPFVI
jgi:protein-S-isoprenylcysteine O-methyltransferase Ste14